MKLDDLTPQKDPKGGSPKTPVGGIPLRRLQEERRDDAAEVLSNDSSAFWRTIACSLIAIIITSFAGFFAFGVDSVKHSEFDTLLQARAPYIHDKARIEDNFRFLTSKLSIIDNELARLHEEITRLDKDDTNISKWTNAEQDKKMSDLTKRLEDLEKSHPK